ncbi:MAG TPA: DUF1360 domain-containing protein [Candidatus Paceibacterota bacterium]|nr:DUF1360 domain-containing protein [Candidatus Paceibacterota bacterium]
MRTSFWDIFFAFFYLAALAYGLMWLAETNRLATWVPTSDFVLMALAVHRLTRLFTYDAITQFIRDWFAGANRGSFLGTLNTLIHCPWCTGLWFAMIVTLAYFATPYAWYVIFILALGSVGSFLQLFSNLIGWYAEARKLEAERMRAQLP